MQTKRSMTSYWTVLLLVVVLSLLTTLGALGASATPVIRPYRGFVACESVQFADTPDAATPTAPSSPTSPAKPSLGQVAYVKDGDISLITLPDGKAQQLTNTGTNSEPRWSPSGDWIAYRSKDQVGIVDSQGQNARVISSDDRVNAFAWEPKEDRLAYVTGKGELWTVAASDPAPVKLMPQDSSTQTQGQVGSFAWNPEGTWIACDLTRVLKQGEDGKPPERSAAIWQVPTAGGDAVKVYDAGSPAENGLILAGWAPGAQEIMFWSDPLFSASLLADGVPLQIVALKGGDPVTLSQPMLLYSDFLSESPDGKLLAVTEGPGRETWTNKQITIMEIPGGKKTASTDKTAASVSPSWAPDSQRIAYVTAPDSGSTGGGTSEPATAQLAKRRIAIRNVDGSGHRQLTNDQEYRDERPLWSADGGTILFARLNPDNKASLWLLSLQDDKLYCVVDDLTPIPDLAQSFRRHIDWADLLDWRLGS